MHTLFYNFVLMLNRRHLRIRVLQALYAWQQTPEKDLAKSEKAFIKSLKEFNQAVIVFLLNLEELNLNPILDANRWILNQIYLQKNP